MPLSASQTRWKGPEMLNQIFVVLTAIVAVSFLLSGIDDFFIDAFYWIRLVYRKLFLGRRIRPIRQQVLGSIPEKWTAIWIPAWHENEVIDKMITHTIECMNYKNFDIFVGTYPNDQATQDAVDSVRIRFPQVEKIVCPNPGPTNKADCLNWVFQGMLLTEQRKGIHYEIIVLHDSEDIAHPLELKLFNWLIPRKDMVQLPVIPLERPASCWTAGTYLDEFAENHLKDLLVRERLTKVIPSAGVGTAINRAALNQIATQRKNELFNINTLTEDYEFGQGFSKLKRTGILAQFTVARTQTVMRGWWRKRKEVRVVHERVAVREFFPDRFRLAVRQKSRWVLGISLQGWKNLGWPPGGWMKYMLYRDRKTLYANVINALGYLVILYWLVNGVIYGWGRGPNLVGSRWISYVIVADTFLMAHRLIQRFVSVARISGWYQAFLSIPRVVVGNAINFVATVMATKQFFVSERSGKRVEWKKTAHVFPSTAQLMQHRRRLGDLLLENRLITLTQLQSALLAQQKHGKKLGEVLKNMGYISERDLLAVLSRQLSVPVGSIDFRSVDQEWLRKLPRNTAETLLALPLHILNGSLEVACADPARPGIKKQLEELKGCSVSMRLASESNLRLAISNAYLSQDGQAGPLLGELLVETRAITTLDLNRALSIQKISGHKLGEILQDLGLISPEMLTAALRKQEMSQYVSEK
jgi:bacteriophage N4 adsorption protein B